MKNLFENKYFLFILVLVTMGFGFGTSYHPWDFISCFIAGFFLVKFIKLCKDE